MLMPIEALYKFHEAAIAEEAPVITQRRSLNNIERKRGADYELNRHLMFPLPFPIAQNAPIDSYHFFACHYL